MVKMLNWQDKYCCSTYFYFNWIRNIGICISAHWRNRCNHLISRTTIFSDNLKPFSTRLSSVPIRKVVFPDLRNPPVLASLVARKSLFVNAAINGYYPDLVQLLLSISRSSLLFPSFPLLYHESYIT